MEIFGSGMAGLLAANVFRRYNPVVREAQVSLPNNHSALLRFRSDVCAKAVGIPFKRVTVHKAISYEGELFSQGTLALNNMYSFKVTGQTVSRSIIKLDSGDRYIAPEDFIKRMAQAVPITFGSIVGAELLQRSPDSDPAISTIPMPTMMGLMAWDGVPKFEARKIWSVSCRIKNCDVYQTIYYPEPGRLHYRASITGDRLVIEYLAEPINPEDNVELVLSDFGIRNIAYEIYVREQKYGKLVPLEDPNVCRKFILYLTDKYRIYSLGRFAIWRQILLDDCVKDLGVIENLIECRDGYQRAIGTK